MEHLSNKKFKYEVILCTSVEANNFNAINTIVKSFSNTSAYEVLSKDIDTVVTYGLGIALGDWVIILEDHENLLIHFDKIFEMITSSENQNYSSIILVDKKVKLRDKVLVFLSSFLMEEKVATFQRASKAVRRSSLTRWNQRSFKNKVLRVASNTNSGSREKREVEVRVDASYNSYRLFRIGLRTIVYSSVTPLRLVGGVSITASVLSAAYSAYIVFIKYNGVTAPGWASTNLLLSVSSLLILIILSALCEYMYQLIGAVVQSNSIRTANESMNSRYSFAEEQNILNTRH